MREPLDASWATSRKRSHNMSTRMTKKQQVLDKIKTFDFKLEDDGSCFYLDAPNGYDFANDTHVRVYEYHWNGKKGIWDAMLEDIQTVLPCFDENCEICVFED